MVKMILCTDANGSIGRNNDLLFKMKEDMQFFRETTKGNTVVMGYNTWLSLGSKPLPKRENIVLTNEKIEGIKTSNNLQKLLCEYKDKDVYIIGGAYVYNQALEMDLVDEILVTVVPLEVMDADAKIDLELTEKFNKRKILKTFVNENGIKVTIEKWNK
jgi:dihydrofolate reductase